MEPVRSSQHATTDVVEEVDVPASSYRMAIHETMALLNGEWVVAVLASLATRPLQYKELRDEINRAEERLGWASHARPVSQKVLSATLRRMRRDGLIDKTARTASFNPVWYQLTPIGRSLLRSLRVLAKWAVASRDAVAEARARYAEAGDSPDDS